MKPTTQARVNRIVSRVESYLTPGQAAALREIVEYELRKQDRNTRHACAEAVTQETQRIARECGKTQVSANTWAIACGSALERACLNTQSI